MRWKNSKPGFDNIYYLTPKRVLTTRTILFQSVSFCDSSNPGPSGTYATTSSGLIVGDGVVAIVGAFTTADPEATEPEDANTVPFTLRPATARPTRPAHSLE